jgi:hypothetical protein
MSDLARLGRARMPAFGESCRRGGHAVVSLTDPGCVETRFCYDSTGESAEAGMAGFIQGVDRGQSTLLPECLEDWADESNPVRVIDAAQERLDRNPNAMRTRRETVEHPFGTLKMRMGATHFLCTTLPKVATEMALCVLGYNLTRVINIVGAEKLLAAIAA